MVSESIYISAGEEVTEMKKKVCTSMVQKEITQSLLFGTLSLASGGLLTYFTGVLSGRLLDIIANFANNFIYICVILFLIIGGTYLLLYGILGLFNLESTNMCKSIHTQLNSEEHYTGKELLSWVDKDLECSQEFAHGMVLIGQEWLLVPKAFGQSIIRLRNIQKIENRGKSDTGIHLRFADQFGHGPITGELTSVDVGAIEICLQSRKTKLEDLK